MGLSDDEVGPSTGLKKDVMKLDGKSDSVELKSETAAVSSDVTEGGEGSDSDYNFKREFSRTML